MAARICPQCRTRVDERRAKMSPYCLSCGAALGSGSFEPVTGFGSKGPGGNGGGKKSSPLPWILGGVGAVFLLGAVVVVLLLVAVANAQPDAPVKAQESADPDSGPLLEVPTAAVVDASAPGKPTATVKIASTGPRITGTATVPVVTPPPTAPVVLGAFPRARAQNELDRVTAGLGSCKRAGDPTGSGSIRVDFEPDGRVGTILQRPFAGTAEGSCISSRFLAIRIGAFQGTTQSITHGFAIAGSSSNPGF